MVDGSQKLKDELSLIYVDFGHTFRLLAGVQVEEDHPMAIVKFLNFLKWQGEFSIFDIFVICDHSIVKFLGREGSDLRMHTVLNC
jgi:hypothetical protein